MKVIFSRFAKLELEDAVHFYEHEFNGLGRRFKKEVQKAATRITRFPKAWSVEHGDIRKCLLHTRQRLLPESEHTISHKHGNRQL